MNITFQVKVLEIESCGWTLTDIANAIGLTVQAVSDIKQGRTKQPNGNAAIALAKLHTRTMRKRKASDANV